MDIKYRDIHLQWKNEDVWVLRKVEGNIYVFKDRIEIYPKLPPIGPIMDISESLPTKIIIPLPEIQNLRVIID